MDINHETRHGKQVIYEANATIRNSVFRVDPASKEFNAVVGCTDPNGKIVFENCIIDGGGVFTHPAYHEGELWFKNCYIKRSPNNGLYLDSPTKAPGVTTGKGGTAHIRGCLLEDNNISHARLNIGSTITDTVIRNTGHIPVWDKGQWSDGGVINSRGLHTFYGYGDFPYDPVVRAERIHVDITADNTNHPPDGPRNYAAFSVKTTGKNGTNPIWEVSDSQIRGPVHAQDRLAGTNVGSSPRQAAPPGVPLTDDDALSGTAAGDTTWTPDDHLDSGSDNGGGGGSGDDTGSGDDDPTPAGTLFELVSAADVQDAAYSFTADGPVVKHTSGDNAADSNDEVIENDDGTYSVGGVAGNGYGDAYYVDGAITTLEYDPAQYTLFWGGDEVTRDDLLGADNGSGDDGETTEPTMRTLSFESPDGDVGAQRYDYAFEAEAIAEKHNVEAADQTIPLADGTVRQEGFMVTGGFVDKYIVEGDIYDLQLDSDIIFTVDGTEVDDPSTIVTDRGDSGGSGDNRWSDRVVQEGDGSTTTFTLSHGLGADPASVNVEPASPQAAADFYIKDTGSDDVVVEYAATPDAGERMAWYLTVWE